MVDQSTNNLKKRPVFYAPMEGVTGPVFRELIQKLYPEWDFLCTDFLRVPGAGKYPNKHIIKHFGRKQFEDEEVKKKTIFQILTSDKAYTEHLVQQINDLGFQYLDLNLGCPSKTVCKNRGGSFILSDMELLKTIIKKVRTHFHGHFSVKIRTGFQDDSLFSEIIKIIEGEGAQRLTIHGRTREQLYKGRASWSYIKQAKETVSIPVIANGDIWTVDDISHCIEQTNCDGTMIGRGALKAPWLASKRDKSTLKADIKFFFAHYKNILVDSECSENFQLRRFKSLTRYMFDDLQESSGIKSRLYRSQSTNSFLNVVGSI